MRQITATRLGRALAGAGVLTLALALGGTASFAGAPTTARPTLTGFASLPAATFVPGSEPSGSLVTGNTNGYPTPFADQPIQGFSGIADNGDGTFDVLSDNGYGNQANSADFLLRIQRLAPVFATGDVDVVGGINLTDPDGHVPWQLTRTDRVLTGADFDVESIVKAADGSYWIGDEFGPYLLHFDRTGRLLRAPIPLDGVVAPETAARTGVPATLASSRGFEGLAASPDGRHLYALLEGTVAGDAPGQLRLNEFDRWTGRYTGKRLTYRLEAPNLAIGDAIAIDRHRFLIIERDGGQGPTAVVKRLYVADARDRDRDGLLDKTLLVDLMNVANPKRLGGFDTTFTFPFQTIENVVILDKRRVAVLNDNNFPFSTGRAPGVAEDNEWIVITLPRSLDPDRRVLR
ncbi:esterase-like activity of phytase family protein [Verrucosispora sp. WMMA2121]|uniref:esterase-like activity of phytase family protein n=1 Tax=Verrucosispora sp. WMMA2121 TaxID=3015164 RepID=UPI0022B71D6E|nr:esterase-like activity of phytase family protein [Verrucosispora sp. WMMA2121]MCZ7424013.1 esterase-like activity of phytase family protein [Verrucosispora sp. WMMA2121]